jgi:hypothetical protein
MMKPPYTTTAAWRPTLFVAIPAMNTCCRYSSPAALAANSALRTKASPWARWGWTSTGLGENRYTASS